MASSNDQHLSRRRFLQRLGAATSGVAALGSSRSLQCSDGMDTPLDIASHIDASRSVDASAIPSLTNPNILIIMVDQFRAPAWLNPTQLSLLETKVLPTIFGQIRNRSVQFNNYYVAAAACSPSRSTLLTGLYSHQTASYCTYEDNNSPSLPPAFPTWGGALATLNPAYKNNVWWFGKWHLTPHSGRPNPLLPYGFRTRRFPSDLYPSPDGMANEGTNGGPFPAPPATPTDYFANDSDIAEDFVDWLQGQTTAPWCATVSFVNPHDICAYPAFFPPKYPPAVTGDLPYFPPPAPPPVNYLFSSLPSPWNYETSQQLDAKKIGLQTKFRKGGHGDVSNWVDFLNWYYWLQHYVDTQVKVVLDAVNERGFANNTIVIFTSDHGEYGGSHGLRGKAGGAYDESIRVPLYIRFPGMSSSATRSQMCSSVDLFGLICDLGTNGAGLWTTRYPDLATRESIFKFIYNANLREQKRIAPGLNAPYVLHTVDEQRSGKNHLVCLRTKSEPGNPYTGAKYGVYSQWAQGTMIPDLSVAPDQEFYDYTNKRNRSELGNDYLNPGAPTATLITKFRQALGNYGPATGIIGNELNRPLIGTGTDGQPLTVAQEAAGQAYLDFIG